MVLQELPELPAWPQLFHRSPMEHMAPQFTDGISDVTIEGDVVTLAGSPGEHDMPELREERAAGFFAFLKSDLTGVTGLKGQVTGPLTFAHLVQMADGGSADENVRIARRLAHLLGRLAEWQENQLRRHTRNTLILLDEPLLAESLADRRLGPSICLDLIATTLMWIKGARGLHTCAPPNWKLLLNLPLQVLSFDAYSYGETTEDAAKGIRGFLANGGFIAWASCLRHRKRWTEKMQTACRNGSHACGGGSSTWTCRERCWSGNACSLLPAVWRVSHHRAPRKRSGSHGK